MSTTSCDCGDSWPTLETRIREENKMVWLGKNTSYFPMVPGPTTISKGVGHIMEIQLWFSCRGCNVMPAQSSNAAVDNTTEAYNAGSLTPAPGIWTAIYDPEFYTRRMVADGQVYTSQFDANSHTTVNIGLVQYNYSSRAVSASARQNMDLVCNISKPRWILCYHTVEIQISSHPKTVYQEEQCLDWTVSALTESCNPVTNTFVVQRVVTEASAFFALVQFFS
jgi:hypothetical protein